MKKFKITALTVLFLSVLITSCSSDDDGVVDTERPTIEIMEPHDHDEFEPGEQIHVNAMLRDNMNLSQFKLDIHYAGDGHTHGRPFKDGDHHHEVEWDYELVESISGTEYELDILISIPEEIMHDGEMHDIKEGEYHLGILVIDAAGNDNEAFMDIEIGHHHHDHDDHDHDDHDHDDDDHDHDHDDDDHGHDHD